MSAVLDDSDEDDDLPGLRSASDESGDDTDSDNDDCDVFEGELLPTVHCRCSLLF